MITKAKPNVVPLCDILLVLLIIFMVISPIAQAGVDVRIPEIGGNGPPIVLTINKKNVIMLNKEKYVTIESLSNRLNNIYQTRSNKTIIVRANRKLPYKYIIQILDIIKGAGVDTILINPKRFR